MFNIGWSEILLIGVVALIAIGPKELPGVLRMVGQWTGKIRRMANEFQGQFQEALREAEMADVRKELEQISAQATDIGEFDPVAETKKELDSAMAEPLPGAPAVPTSEIAPLEGAKPEPEPVPLPEVNVPLPEAPSPVTEADFAPPVEPVKKQAGSGA